ncbi:MAG: dihydropteroate synthase [Terriglobales bacterium]
MNYIRPTRAWRCGERIYALGTRTWVMAIVNLTPDSFYAASRQPPGDVGAVVEHCAEALNAGADVVDLGAESTRPGAAPLPAASEQARLLPALAAVRRAFPDALVSADTRHAATAAAALAAGADIINDVTGGGDPAMLPVLARARCGVVLMHHRGEFMTMQHLPPLSDPLAAVQAGLGAIVERVREAGVAAERVMLDPGFGFGKNLDENIPVLAGLDRLHALGRPLLAGLSRKSFLRHGSVDPDAGPEQRLPASLAAATAAALAGAHMLRVHDVGPTVAAARIADRLLIHAKSR